MHALYESGATLEEVARAYGLSPSYVGNLFRAAGLPRRSQGGYSPADRYQRLLAMHALYRTGATLEEVGRRFGVTGECVWWFFRDAGLPTRTPSQAALLESERRRGRQAERHGEDIVARFQAAGEVSAVATEFGVPQALVERVVRSRIEAHRAFRKHARPPRRLSDAELLECLVIADEELGVTLSGAKYDSVARDRRLPDRRSWPKAATIKKRFGSWRKALKAAGLPTNPVPASAYRRRYEPRDCVLAVQEAWYRLGHPPAGQEYVEYRRGLRGLPSYQTVVDRLGSWQEALRGASSDTA